jgi:hypothetical protein
MSLEQITRDNIENFTLETNPKRVFVSSSNGITGSVFLFANNEIVKDVLPENFLNQLFFTEEVRKKY